MKTDYKEILEIAEKIRNLIKTKEEFNAYENYVNSILHYLENEKFNLLEVLKVEKELNGNALSSIILILETKIETVDNILHYINNFILPDKDD